MGMSCACRLGSTALLFWKERMLRADNTTVIVLALHERNGPPIPMHRDEFVVDMATGVDHVPCPGTTYNSYKVQKVSAADLLKVLIRINHVSFCKLTYFSLLGNHSDCGKYPKYCCVFLCCWLFTLLSFYICLSQFILCSFCVIHYCKQSWLMVNKIVGLRSYQQVSYNGRRVSTNHFLFSGPTAGA